MNDTPCERFLGTDRSERDRVATNGALAQGIVTLTGGDGAILEVLTIALDWRSAPPRALVGVVNPSSNAIEAPSRRASRWSSG